MNKSPAFQFYPKDWLSSRKVLMMNLEQEGAYIRLLCYCWDSGDCSLPDDDEELSVLSRLGEGWFKGGSTMIRKCFMAHPDKPGYLTNERLYTEQQKQRAWREKSSEGGKKSAETRRRSKGGLRVVQPRINRPVEPNGNITSASSSATAERGENIPSGYDAEFEEFWSLYPPNFGRKGRAFKAYTTARKGASHGRIIEGVRKFADFTRAESRPDAKRYTPHASTWLNDRGWETDYQSATQSGGIEPASGGHRPRPRKPTWQSEGERLAAKYREQAQCERQGATGDGTG